MNAIQSQVSEGILTAANRETVSPLSHKGTNCKTSPIGLSWELHSETWPSPQGPLFEESSGLRPTSSDS